MKTTWKILLAGAGALLLLAVAAAAALLANSHRKLQRTITVAAAPVAYAEGAEAAQRGRYLYLSRGCGECHGEDGAGRVFIEHPNGLFARGANLTVGTGSAVRHYNEGDWVRAVRHGVKPGGRPVFVMPSEDYNRLSDPDLADLVAYVRALPPRDAAPAEIRLPLLVRLVHGAGLLRDAAEKIDHRLPPAQPVPVAVSVEHGFYVSRSCIGCHGAALKGGRIPGAPPDWPPAADLTRDGGLLASRYPDAARFKTLVRTGLRPDGTPVHTAMPRNQHMNDTDLDALHLFLSAARAPDASP